MSDLLIYSVSASGKTYPSSASMISLADFVSLSDASVVVCASVVLSSVESATFPSPTSFPSLFFLLFVSSCTAFFNDVLAPSLSVVSLLVTNMAIRITATTAIAAASTAITCFSFFCIFLSFSLVISVNSICNSFCKHCLIMTI